MSLVSASGGPRTNGGACRRTVNVRILMNNFGPRTCSTKTSPTCFPLTKSKLNREAWWEFFTHLFKSKSLGKLRWRAALFCLKYGQRHFQGFHACRDHGCKPAQFFSVVVSGTNLPCYHQCVCHFADSACSRMKWTRSRSTLKKKKTRRSPFNP